MESKKENRSCFIPWNKWSYGTSREYQTTYTSKDNHSPNLKSNIASTMQIPIVEKELGGYYEESKTHSEGNIEEIGKDVMFLTHKIHDLRIQQATKEIN